jgi:hypothetical protein
MGKQKAVSILVGLAVLVAAGAAFVLWPKPYSVGQQALQTTVFWNDREAFVFLAESTTGRAENVFQEKLAGTRYGYLTAFLGGFPSFVKPEVVAYHLLSNGQIERFALPEHTATYGSWGLAEGRLQLTPMPGTSLAGFRWDGAQFVAIPPLAARARKAVTTPSTLSEDDLDDHDEAEDPLLLLSKTARKSFKEAGWHYKLLSGYQEGGSLATLPINLDGNTFSLTLESSPLTKDAEARFDFMTIGTKNIRLAGDKLPGGAQTLWNQSGWREVSKQDYDELQRQYGRKMPTSWTPFAWLLLLGFLMLWRFGSWIHVLFTFATMKSRVLKKLPASYSFPPATPAQFPALDLDALERYTREFEAMGFTRLLDFSLVTNTSSHPPSFCRLFAHTRHHCFGELSQLFPKGKAPLPLKCSIQSCLQNGWTLGFSDRKPQAVGSLLRRKKALGVSMPEVTSSELLAAFLKMRDQICLDLGISPVNDDSLQAYIDKMQRSLGEMREAVQEKNFVKGVPEVYLRKFSLIKTKPEYVWLGDYPKEAEQRKKGFNSFAAGAQ